MAFMTPRGLKIRFPVRYAFGLMSRLSPERSAFRVLKTTEGLENMQALVSFVAGMFFLLKADNVFHLAIAIVLGRLAGFAIVHFGLFVIPGLVSVATTMSYVSGYGLFLLVAVVMSVIVRGRKTAAMFAGAWLFAILLSTALEFLMARIRFNQSRLPITLSEMCFINAFRLHASALGRSTDLELTTEEAEMGWHKCLEEYADNYPESVSRFPSEG